MLRSLREMQGFKIHASDGDLGRVDDFYFDDEAWGVRYLVVETGNWLTGRRVLISPISVSRTDWPARQIHVSLTREQVHNSPDFDTAMPVSRREEEEFFRYYGWPIYWLGGGLWGPWLTPNLASPSATGPDLPAALPATPAGAPDRAHEPETGEIEAEEHLRSVAAVTGDTVVATDGELGRVSDFLLQDLNWSIQYLIVNASPVAGAPAQGPGRVVAVRPGQISGVDWVRNRVTVNAERAAISDSRPPDLSGPLDRQPWNNEEPGGAR